MRPVGLRSIFHRRLTQLPHQRLCRPRCRELCERPALKGPRAGSDRVSPAIGEKSCSKRLNGGA